MYRLRQNRELVGTSACAPSASFLSSHSQGSRVRLRGQLNLSDGHIGCGRKQLDGSGGNGHALAHYEATGKLFPLCVKVSLTPSVDKSCVRVMCLCPCVCRMHALCL